MKVSVSLGTNAAQSFTTVFGRNELESLPQDLHTRLALAISPGDVLRAAADAADWLDRSLNPFPSPSGGQDA